MYLSQQRHTNTRNKWTCGHMHIHSCPPSYSHKYLHTYVHRLTYILYIHIHIHSIYIHIYIHCIQRGILFRASIAEGTELLPKQDQSHLLYSEYYACDGSVVEVWQVRFREANDFGGSTCDTIRFDYVGSGHHGEETRGTVQQDSILAKVLCVQYAVLTTKVLLYVVCWSPQVGLNHLI